MKEVTSGSGATTDCLASSAATKGGVNVCLAITGNEDLEVDAIDGNHQIETIYYTS